MTGIDVTRVLAISGELPWPLDRGGYIRSYHLLSALAQRFEVRLVAAVTADSPGVEALRRQQIKVHAVTHGRRRLIGDVRRALRAAFHREPYVMFHRHNLVAVQRVIREELERHPPDVVYLDHLDPLAFRPLFPDATLVIDMHNVYSKLTNRMATGHLFPLRQYLRREAHLLARMERRAAAAAETVLAVSQEEQRDFQGIGGRNVYVVPNGVACSAYRHMPVGRRHEPPVLLYLGSLSWSPNARAAAFLARQVLPEVRQRHPHAVLQIVGRNPSPRVRSLEELPGVQIHANVPDVHRFLESATLLVVPLQAGGGTRLKILEAFAAGLPVVSTSIGCEGIDCLDGRHLWLAERDEFTETVLQALAAPDLGRRLAEMARSLAQERYDWSVIGERACDAVAAAAS